MTVRCLFFASLAGLAGGSEQVVEVPPGSTLADLVAELESRYPGLRAYGRVYRVALEGRLAELSEPLPDGAEVALLPPVSGGTGDLVRLTEGPVSVDECLQAVRRPDCGAVVLFLGTARNHSQGQPVERLEYQAYPRMALAELEALASEVRRRFPVGGLALWHRYGSLAPGEISVAVAVSSPHRKEAFEAARWAIDTLKVTVPLWKREIGPQGAVWIEGDARRPG
ncbi:MAG TPA: molybdenum cofactor biosynthesis protein MoaE [Candidatus Nitrosotenuis sp.]|nr:molybdenum cofactor biosynthesis protein MoaE [Candidatus Nitrosotenuis sp.]